MQEVLQSAREYLASLLHRFGVLARTLTHSSPAEIL